MFTGIIEEIGTVKALGRGTKSFTLEVGASLVLDGLHVGDSIATNGVCLTVTEYDKSGFTADIMPETVERTALKLLRPGDHVNLERALSLAGRFGGHLVTGHVDATGRIASCRKDDTALWLTVETEPQVLRYIVEKGSVALDGVSLTVVKVGVNSFTVSLIPHTQTNTTLHERRVGKLVNIENDIIAKYVERLAGLSEQSSRSGADGLSLEFLYKHGF